MSVSEAEWRNTGGRVAHAFVGERAASLCMRWSRGVSVPLGDVPMPACRTCLARDRDRNPEEARDDA